MKTEKEIAELLFNELDLAYDDNCEGITTKNPNFCDGCHSKSICWALRKDTAEYLARKICE